MISIERWEAFFIKIWLSDIRWVILSRWSNNTDYSLIFDHKRISGQNVTFWVRSSRPGADQSLLWRQQKITSPQKHPRWWENTKKQMDSIIPYSSSNVNPSLSRPWNPKFLWKYFIYNLDARSSSCNNFRVCVSAIALAATGKILA